MSKGLYDSIGGIGLLDNKKAVRNVKPLVPTIPRTRIEVEPHKHIGMTGVPRMNVVPLDTLLNRRISEDAN